MQPSTPTPLAFINADSAGAAQTLRISGRAIASLNEKPTRGDRIIDLKGDRLLPGLINAHDHLQLNSIGRFEHRTSYRNAGEWIAEISASRAADAAFAATARLSRERRLFAGAMKNLLSGVTTVAHHDPLYPALLRREFPVGVVREFGWSHSLQIDGEECVRRSYQTTPDGQPWIIHAAEGIDAESAAEFERLDALGCIGPKTLLVHGVALTSIQQARLATAGAALVWCPASNLHLFGSTADVAALLPLGRIAFGTDSRLTGSRDLLDELRVARAALGCDEQTLESLVTRDNARLLRLPDRGALRVARRADLIVLPAGMALSQAARSDVRLVMIGGRMLYGDWDYAELLAPQSRWTSIRIDGRTKALDRRLASDLHRDGVHEDGLELPPSVWETARAG